MAQNTNQQTRVLVAARLSIAGDRSEESRIERDEEQARTWADANDADVVKVTKDRGVSGSVSPLKRPSLGPWLTDPALIAQYDAIVASTIDRLGRSARDLDTLKAWAEDNGKHLIVLKPDLVWPVAPGVAGAGHRIMWSLLADLAEIERETIKERIAGGVGQARDNGAFVGRPTFGFEVVGSKYGKTLRPIPALEPVLRGMIERAKAGEGYASIARWLNTATDANGHRVLPVQAGKGIKGKKGIGSDLWSPTSVAQILRSTDLKGRRTEKGRTHRFDSLLSVSEWNELQAALPVGQRGQITSETPLLTGILLCEKCGGPMYRIAATSKSRAGEYNYRCTGTDQEPSRCANAVPLDDIESWVSAWFTADGPFANVEIVETVVTPGDDHKAEADELADEIKALDLDTPDYAARHAGLVADRAALLALPTEAATVIECPTGRTVGDVWTSLDQAARRGYLKAAGVEVYVLSNSALRADPGREVRYITGDPHKVIGTLQGIVEAADAAVNQVAG